MSIVRDVRLRVAVFLFAAIALGGAAFAWLTPAPGTADPAAATLHERELHRRFMQGVAMLHAKRYEYAVVAFDRAIELSPQLPEAHVNMGFALLGLERPADARGFFERAIALRKDQLNAYYGLGIALESLHDLAGAVGAMRTYVHLGKADDPHMRTAQAALWEWEAALANERRQSQ